MLAGCCAGPSDRLIVLLLCVCLSACSQEIERTYPLSDCSTLQLEGNLHVSVKGMQAGRSGEMSLQATPAAHDELVIEALGRSPGTRVALPSAEAEIVIHCACPQHVSLMGRTRLVAEGCPMNSIRAYGNSTVHVGGLAPDAVELRASGDSQIVAEHIDTDRLDVYVNGASLIALYGSAATLQVQLTGASRLAAEALKAQTVKVRARGESEAAVWATAHLSLDVSQGSAVTHSGQPDISHIETNSSD